MKIDLVCRIYNDVKNILKIQKQKDVFYINNISEDKQITDNFVGNKVDIYV